MLHTQPRPIVIVLSEGLSSASSVPVLQTFASWWRILLLATMFWSAPSRATATATAAAVRGCERTASDPFAAFVQVAAESLAPPPRSLGSLRRRQGRRSPPSLVPAALVTPAGAVFTRARAPALAVGLLRPLLRNAQQHCRRRSGAIGFFQPFLLLRRRRCTTTTTTTASVSSIQPSPV